MNLGFGDFVSSNDNNNIPKGLIYISIFGKK